MKVWFGPPAELGSRFIKGNDPNCELVWIRKIADNRPEWNEPGRLILSSPIGQGARLLPRREAYVFPDRKHAHY